MPANGAGSSTTTRVLIAVLALACSCARSVAPGDLADARLADIVPSAPPDARDDATAAATDGPTSQPCTRFQLRDAGQPPGFELCCDGLRLGESATQDNWTCAQACNWVGLACAYWGEQTSLAETCQPANPRMLAGCDHVIRSWQFGQCVCARR